MYDAILGHVTKHVRLTEADKEEIIKRLQIRKVRKRQYLVIADEPCKYEHFINRGCFRVFYVGDDGKEYITRFAAEDGWITDLESFHYGKPATLYVEALEAGEVALITKDDMEALFRTVPALNVYFRIIYQNAVIANQQRVLRAISSRTEHQYLEFIKRYPDIERRVPQYMIAAYLGVTPEFFSKLKLQLAKNTASNA